MALFSLKNISKATEVAALTRFARRWNKQWRFPKGPELETSRQRAHSAL